MKPNRVVVWMMLLALGAASDLSGAGVGKSVARSATRRLAQRSVARAASRGTAVASAAHLRKPIPNILKRDRLRDRNLPVKTLTDPRRVFRYTTNKQAQFYRRHGVPSGTHFTAKAGPGRPLSAVHAKERYGLPSMPSTRVEVALPKGTTVKSGKVIGGEPGVGELKTYRRRLPPPAVKSVIHLRK